MSGHNAVTCANTSRWVAAMGGQWADDGGRWADRG